MVQPECRAVLDDALDLAIVDVSPVPRGEQVIYLGAEHNGEPAAGDDLGGLSGLSTIRYQPRPAPPASLSIVCSSAWAASSSWRVSGVPLTTEADAVVVPSK